MMRLFRFDDPEHDEATALLPWLVNGTLDAGERARVERHLAECAACRHEVANLRALQAYVARDDRDRPLTQALARINARLDETDWVASPGRMLRRIASEWMQARPWLRAAVMGQAAALALLIVLLWAEPAPQYYRTLSATPVRANAAAALVVACRRATNFAVRRRSVAVRTRYITASTRPHARLQPSAARIIVLTSSRPAVATLSEPVKLSAISRPKMTSDTRSTGLNTGARCSPLISGIFVLPYSRCRPASRLSHREGHSVCKGCAPARRRQRI